MSALAPPPHSRRRAAFTLVELLVSMVILSLILVTVASIASSARLAWSNGEQRAEVYQSGRAILELITRELRHSVISPKLQFVQSPLLTLNGPEKQLTNSSSLFWQANLASTSKGSLCEVGYFLTNHNELKRFFVRPDDATNYQIFALGFGTSNSSSPAPWVTGYVAQQDANRQPLSTSISGGILGFWVRCLDVNGDPVPYVANNEIKFNSTDYFQPAIPGVRSADFSDPTVNPSSFRYTASTTARANLLPSAVELYVLTVDRATDQRIKALLARGRPVSSLNQSSVPDNVTYNTTPMGVPDNVTGYQEYLRQTFAVKNSQVFYSRVQPGVN